MNLEQQQQENEQAFAAGFAEVSGQEVPPAPPAPEPAPAPPPEAAEAPPAEPAPGEAAPAPAPAAAGSEDDDPVVFDGLKQSELRNALAQVGKLGELVKMVDKAHGKIGELNRTIEEIRKPAATPASAPAPAAPAPAPAEELSDFERDYPEFVAYVQKATSKQVSAPAAEPAPEPAPPQPSPAAAPGIDDQQLQFAVMDTLHEGWREKVQSQDFNLWLATQPEDVRTTFDTSGSAKDLNAILGKFDTWTVARGVRKASGQERLEQALTPAGHAGKPKTAPSAEDEFNAGFRSVLGN